MANTIYCKCGAAHKFSCSDFEKMQAKGITQIAKCSQCKVNKLNKKEAIKVERSGSEKKFDGEFKEVTK